MLLLCSPSHLPVRTCPCATPHPTPRVSPPPPPRAPPTSTFSVLPAGGLGPPVPSGSFPRWWAGDLGAVQRPGKCVPFYTPPDLWRDFGETRGPPRTSAGGRDGHRESLPSRWGGREAPRSLSGALGPIPPAALAKEDVRETRLPKRAPASVSPGPRLHLRDHPPPSASGASPHPAGVGGQRRGRRAGTVLTARGVAGVRVQLRRAALAAGSGDARQERPFAAARADY